MSERFVMMTWEFIRDKDTTMQEKFILAEIEALTALEHGCIAHNDHFAELLGVKKESISRSINSLKNKGYINVEIVNGSRNHDRRITLNKLLFGGKQNVIDPLTNCYRPITKCLETKGNKPINKPINKDIGKRKRFDPPTIEDCFLYCQDKDEAEKFWHYYESNGWKVGKNKMKNWKSALSGWMKRAEGYNQSKPTPKKQWDDLTEDEKIKLFYSDDGVQLDEETKRFYGID